MYDQTFSNTEFSDNTLEKEYENCVFENCNFEGLKLSDVAFAECEFHNCNLSSTVLHNTAFKTIAFFDCKLVGLHFEDCNSFLFEVKFTNCNLQLSSFYQCKNKAGMFESCDLSEVDFTETDLENATITSCDLKHTIFENTNLKKANLTNCTNIILNPEINQIKGATFSKESLAGLLSAYQIKVTE